MKRRNQMIVIALFIGAFASGMVTYHYYISKPENIKLLILDHKQSPEILLDSAILQTQLKLLAQDSVSSMYLLYQMQRIPMTSYYMIECLRRNRILDETNYKATRSKMFMYCCL